MQATNKNCILLACWLCAGLMAGGVAAAEAVIVNKTVAVDSIDKETLRAVMSMRLRVWADGTPVHVFVLPDRHPAHQRFSKRILSLFPHQLRRTWDRLVYTGIGQAPTELQNPQEMLRQVATTPGAIGYIDKEMIDDSVRQLTIE